MDIWSNSGNLSQNHSIQGFIFSSSISTSKFPMINILNFCRNFEKFFLRVWSKPLNLLQRRNYTFLSSNHSWTDWQSPRNVFPDTAITTIKIGEFAFGLLKFNGVSKNFFRLGIWRTKQSSDCSSTRHSWAYISTFDMEVSSFTSKSLFVRENKFMLLQWTLQSGHNHHLYACLLQIKWCWRM